MREAIATEVGAEEVVFADATGRGHSYELIADTMELPASAPASGGRRSATGEVRPTGGKRQRLADVTVDLPGRRCSYG